MTRAFLFLMIGVTLIGFFTVDFSALGGDTAFGWLCPENWHGCHQASGFLKSITP